MLFSPSCASIILCTCHLKRQEDGTNALFSFAMVKRNVLAEHVYTFLIISGAICIIRPNQAIYQGLPRTTLTSASSRANFRRKMGMERNIEAFVEWMPMKVVSIFIGLILCLAELLLVCSAEPSWRQQNADASSYLFVCAPKWPKCEVQPKEASAVHTQRDTVHFCQDYTINIMSRAEAPHCIIHVFVKSYDDHFLVEMKIALWEQTKTRLCIQLQGKQWNSLRLHKRKHLGPPPKLISAAAFAPLEALTRWLEQLAPGPENTLVQQNFLGLCWTLTHIRIDSLLKSTTRLPSPQNASFSVLFCAGLSLARQLKTKKRQH